MELYVHYGYVVMQKKIMLKNVSIHYNNRVNSTVRKANNLIHDQKHTMHNVSIRVILMYVDKTDMIAR